MIKNLLKLLVIIFLFSGCDGDGEGISITYLEQPRVGPNEVFVYIEDECFSLNPFSAIVLSCEQFYEQIDIEQIETLEKTSIEEGSILCYEITIKDIEGKEHTGFYRDYEKGSNCD